MIWRRILVAVDGSETSLHAATQACDLARSCNAEVGFVHVSGSELAGVTGRAILEATKSTAADGVNPTLFLRTGSSIPEIIGCASQWNADVIVLGSGGQANGGPGRVAAGVLALMPCPVLIVATKRRPGLR
jgi:nucleotide-binding universal stress UspA family protein